MYPTKRPHFTQEQQDFIFTRISEWYLDWKHQIVSGGIEHRLGFAKEILKMMILGDGSKEIQYKNFTIHIYEENRYELRFNPVNMIFYRDFVQHLTENQAIEAAKAKIDSYNME